MDYLYIDESGSMTSEHAARLPYFVITVVRAMDGRKLISAHKRFVRGHMEELKAADTGGRMFAAGKFRELKGSALTPALKRSYVSRVCGDGLCQVFYIVIDNAEVSATLYANTSRAFNYVLKLALEYLFKHGYLPDASYSIKLDERNERTETKHFLKNYLNTEFRLEGVLSADIELSYSDSAGNSLIQTADVLSNLCYSQLCSRAYTAQIDEMWDKGCLRHVFWFPQRETLSRHGLLEHSSPPAT